MTAKRETTRRDFLQGKSALESLADWTHGVGAAASESGGLAPPGADAYLVHVGRRAMACLFEIFLNAGQYPAGTAGAIGALDLVDQLEDQLTVYREHSEVMAINREAHDAPVAVEPRLFALLQQAVRLYEQTEGAFDITAGPLAKAWGFYRRQGAIPDAPALQHALACVGTKFLDLDEEFQTVRFSASGVEINLGAIGKGYALDRAAEFLIASGVEDFLLHGGQSSVLARGSRAGETNGGQGWRVGVKHPLRPAARLAEIRLVDRAVGTSGSGSQFFRHQGRRYGHILDARTGWPAEGVLSATAIAPTAAEADALSTAFYVLGVDRAMQFCQKHPQVGMAMVRRGERSGTVTMHTVGLSDEELLALDDIESIQ